LQNGGSNFLVETQFSFLSEADKKLTINLTRKPAGFEDSIYSQTSFCSISVIESFF
jgi:hypothetical protein